jgi:hypothetical protein
MENLAFVVALFVIVVSLVVASFAEAAILKRIGWVDFRRGAIFTFFANMVTIVFAMPLAFFGSMFVFFSLLTGLGFESAQSDPVLENVGYMMLLLIPVLVFAWRRLLIRLMTISHGARAWGYAVVSALAITVVGAVTLALSTFVLMALLVP